MNPLYPKLANNTVPKLLKKYGQPCSILSAVQTGYEVNQEHLSGIGEQSVCAVMSREKYGAKDIENPIALEEGAVSILLQAKVKPQKGGAIIANSRTYRILRHPVEINPAGLAVLYRVTATDKTIAVIQLHPDDLTHAVTIAERSITGDHPDAISQKTTKLCAIECVKMACKSVVPVENVQGLNVSEKSSTHVFYARFADVSVTLDKQVHTLVHNEVNYRIEAVDNINQMNVTLAIYCTQRGDENEGRA